MTEKVHNFSRRLWSEELAHEKHKKLKKFSKEHNLKLYLSGVSSYSPSLYNAQLDLLLSEFNIKPKQIIVLIIPILEMNYVDIKIQLKKLMENI